MEMNVKMSSIYEENRLMLMEMNVELIHALERDGEITIKGSDNDEAILTTDSESYIIKRAETSNMLLLFNMDKDMILNIQTVKNDENKSNNEMDIDKAKADAQSISKIPLILSSDIKDAALSSDEWGFLTSHSNSNSKLNVDIQTSVAHHLELHKVAPRLDHLRVLLSESPMKGFETEQDKKKKKLYTFIDLLNLVQASKNELKQALKDIGAFESSDGYWRTLDPFFAKEVFEMVLAEIALQKIPILSFETIIHLDSIASALKDLYPFEAIQHTIKMNCTDLNTIDPEKVAKSCACNLLRYSSSSDNSSKKSSGLPIDEFVQKWKEILPHGIEINMDLLKSITYVENIHGVTWIKYLDSNQLPSDPKMRFQALFQIKKEWTQSDLSPHIRSLVKDGQQTEANLLRQHTRTFVDPQTGERLFSKR